MRYLLLAIGVAAVCYICRRKKEDVIPIKKDSDDQKYQNNLKNYEDILNK